jgi:hypothetical protein
MTDARIELQAKGRMQNEASTDLGSIKGMPLRLNTPRAEDINPVAMNDEFLLDAGAGRFALVCEEDEVFFKLSSLSWVSRLPGAFYDGATSLSAKSFYVRRTEVMGFPHVELSRVIARLQSPDGAKLADGSLKFEDGNTLNCTRNNLVVTRRGKKYNVGVRLRWHERHSEVPLWP